MNGLLILGIGPIYTFFTTLLYRVMKESLRERVAFSEEEVLSVVNARGERIYSRERWRSTKVYCRVFSLSLTLIPLYLFLLSIPTETPPPLIISQEPPSIEVKEEERNLVREMGLSKCLSFSSSEGDYCYTRKLWSPIMRDSYKYQSEEISLYSREERGEFFIDQYEHHHQSLLVMTQSREEERIVLRREIVSENSLIGRLDEIERGEGERCICPVFLGIYDNISLIHFRQKEWILMRQPSLLRVPSDAKLVKTRVYFSRDSLFHGFIKNSDGGVKRLYEHYDKFEVSFDSLSFSPSAGEEEKLSDLNRGKNETFIFFQVPQKYKRRISLLLEGENAICFTFCHHHSPLPHPPLHQRE